MSWVTEGLEFVPVSSTRHHIIPTVVLVYNLISLHTIIKLCSVIRNVQTLQTTHQNCCVLGCWVLFQCLRHWCYFSSGKVLTKAFIWSSAWSNDVWHGSEHFKSLFKVLLVGSPKSLLWSPWRLWLKTKAQQQFWVFGFLLFLCACLVCRTSPGFLPAVFQVARLLF